MLYLMKVQPSPLPRTPNPGPESALPARRGILARCTGRLSGSPRSGGEIPDQVGNDDSG